ncbi:hypothetical protein NY98_02750 [Xanthomonas citri pv. fuscans]|uniref:Transposase n=4 Tax=Xanthomonas citri TaxID=346 RepID=A0AB33CF37_XANCI|nr:hypothetical protein TP37_03270 [Xanthomonas citri pv. aurantifolii]ASK90885.1 hypothetical protein XcvCFBP7111P_04695 [Xanthomonas citri pv. vignicola]AZU18983.1 hypothetical protein AC613_18570 [Xanthomonas citri pv. fuscans]KGP33240.1 hypothetical protein NY65_00185 [Xanthomonas phaseoli pv. phaseoli]MBZ3922428.1 hypothetical protein [Xanthomonas campestris pv. trichodesmae]MBZ3923201.1 hypothetical protein [Xanthomonas citri pv. sesbaniae]MBZ3930852.1 hypothetical protein [Xanthomonas 
MCTSDSCKFISDQKFETPAIVSAFSFLERRVRLRESATARGRHTACLGASRHGSGAWQRYPGTLRKVA